MESESEQGGAECGEAKSPRPFCSAVRKALSRSHEGCYHQVCSHGWTSGQGGSQGWRAGSCGRQMEEDAFSLRSVSSPSASFSFSYSHEHSNRWGKVLGKGGAGAGQTLPKLYAS